MCHKHSLTSFTTHTHVVTQEYIYKHTSNPRKAIIGTALQAIKSTPTRLGWYYSNKINITTLHT